MSSMRALLERVACPTPTLAQYRLQPSTHDACGPSGNRGASYAGADGVTVACIPEGAAAPGARGWGVGGPGGVAAEVAEAVGAAAAGGLAARGGMSRSEAGVPAAGAVLGATKTKPCGTLEVMGTAVEVKGGQCEQ